MSERAHDLDNITGQDRGGRDPTKMTLRRALDLFQPGGPRRVTIAKPPTISVAEVYGFSTLVALVIQTRFNERK